MGCTVREGDASDGGGMRLTYSVGVARGDWKALGGSGMGWDGGKTQPRKSLLGLGRNRR
jgi:hypothetical protein